MRTAIAVVLVVTAVVSLAFHPANGLVVGQEKKVEKAPDPKKEEVKEAPETKFDQKKADLETIKAGNIAFDGKALLDFFQKHTVSDDSRLRLRGLIEQLGDDDFDRREQASEQIETFGVSAIGMLKQAERTANPEVLRRCERCLKNIEKVPTRTLASSAARLLAELKTEGATETLLNYLPLAEDDVVADDVRLALAGLAMKDAKPDAVLAASMDSKEVVKRSAALEAFARGGDKAMRDQIRKRMATETDAEIKLRIAIALVSIAKNKDVVEDMIRLMAEAPPESAWRAEEILICLAGEKGPTTTLGGDKVSREKARDEWLKWWKENESNMDLAKLDQSERMHGYTLIIEMDIRGIGGRVKEITPDGKARWEIINVQFPTDAVVLPGNRVVVSEQNNNRVSERDTASGKEIWAETINQPINLQRLSNGHLVVIGRHQIIEWDQNRKAVSTITRAAIRHRIGREVAKWQLCDLQSAGPDHHL